MNRIIFLVSILFFVSNALAKDCSAINPQAASEGAQCDYGKSVDDEISKITGGAAECNLDEVRAKMKENAMRTCVPYMNKLKETCGRKAQADAAQQSGAYGGVDGKTNSNRTSANMIMARDSMEKSIDTMDSQSDKCGDTFIEVHTNCDKMRQENIALANTCSAKQVQVIKDHLKQSVRERVQQKYCKAFKNHIYNRMAQYSQTCQRDNMNGVMKTIDKSSSLDL